MASPHALIVERIDRVTDQESIDEDKDELAAFLIPMSPLEVGTEPIENVENITPSHRHEYFEDLVAAVLKVIDETPARDINWDRDDWNSDLVYTDGLTVRLNGPKGLECHLRVSSPRPLIVHGLKLTEYWKRLHPHHLRQTQ